MRKSLMIHHMAINNFSPHCILVTIVKMSPDNQYVIENNDGVTSRVNNQEDGNSTCERNQSLPLGKLYVWENLTRVARVIIPT